MRNLLFAAGLVLFCCGSGFAQEPADPALEPKAITPEEAVGVATILPTTGVETIVTRSPPQGIGASLNNRPANTLRTMPSGSKVQRRSIDGALIPRPANSNVQNRPSPVQDRPDGSWSVGSRTVNNRDGSRTGGNLLSTPRTGSIGGNDSY